MWSCSYAPLGLRNTADLGGELGRALWKELVQLFDRDSRLLAQRADGRGGAGCEVALAHEAHDEPVALGERVDARLARDRVGDRLVPLRRILEESLGVHCEIFVGQHHGRGHGSSLLQSEALSGL